MTEERRLLKLKSGCVCDFGDRLYEEYEKGDGYITANISTDKIEKLVQYFVMVHDEPMTFTLKLPLDEDVMDAGSSAENYAVYEIERCSVDDMLLVLIRAGKILIEDGVSSFEIEGEESGEKISFGRFNVTNIYGQDLEFVEDFFGPHNVPLVEKVTTAFDILAGADAGGDDADAAADAGSSLTAQCNVYEENGKTVFDLPEKLSEMGMRPAKSSEN